MTGNKAPAPSASASGRGANPSSTLLSANNDDGSAAAPNPAGEYSSGAREAAFNPYLPGNQTYPARNWDKSSEAGSQPKNNVPPNNVGRAAAKTAKKTKSGNGRTTRKRNQTPAQKELQKQRTAATKKKTREARLAREAEAAKKAEQEKKRAEEKNRQQFFLPHSEKQTTEGESENVNNTSLDGVVPEEASASAGGPADNTESVPVAADTGDAPTPEDAKDDKDELVVEHHNAKTYYPFDIIANLDFDYVEEAGKNDSDKTPNETYGVQQKYVEAIQKRIQEEVRGDFEGDSWLIKLLNENDWWVRKTDAYYVAKKLGLKKESYAYYRDVYIWLPDIRWKDVEKTFMPCCPNCKIGHPRVGPHGFRDNHAGRVVVHLKETYYVISRRYICHECKREVKKAKQVLEQNAAERGLECEMKDSERNYTFMGWDKRILPLFKRGKGELFPAVLSWKAGVDKLLVDLMRPLLDGGFRPERFSDLLLELHSKEFTRKCILHEYEIEARKESLLNKNKEYLPLGEFGDKYKYCGMVPTGKYLANQKTRSNVHNLGMFAKNRDIVQDGGASLDLVARRVLNFSVDKSLQCSDWSGDHGADVALKRRTHECLDLRLFRRP